MSSKIEQLILEIEELIEGCKYQPLSSTKIVVNKEEIDELLRDLKKSTPEEIKRYQKIIANKEAILNDAKEKAENLLKQAEIQTNQLISEHEIMQQAYAQANEIVSLATKQAQDILDNATQEANSMRAAAMQYTDEILANLEALISHSISDIQGKCDGLLGSLDHYNEIIRSNRNELYPQDVAEEIELTEQNLTPESMSDLETI